MRKTDQIWPPSEVAPASMRFAGLVDMAVEEPNLRGAFGEGLSASGRRRRWPYFGLAWLLFAVGLAGVALPLLPTTPFMIMAAWAFGKSSPRLERWLREHPWFGPGVRRFQEQRVISPQAKCMAWAVMAGTLLVAVFSSRMPWWALVAQVPLMGYGAWYLARCPSRVQE